MAKLVRQRSNTDAAVRKLTSEYFSRIKSNSLDLLQPHLVAIYCEITEPRVKTEQIGTGFLINHMGRPVLITAKHTLYGPAGDEIPGEKAIFVSGSLKMIGHLRPPSEIVHVKGHDIAGLYVDEFSLEKCLPSSSLSPVDATPRTVTIHGFLARNFKRETVSGLLRPAPRVYTNSGKDHGSGYIGLRYPKSRNRSTDSGKKVMAPRPSGMSGCAMLDGDKLAQREISVVGVFTDYCQDRGIAFGESSAKIIALLGQM